MISIPSSSSSATHNTRQVFRPIMTKACMRSCKSGPPFSPAAARCSRGPVSVHSRASGNPAATDRGSGSPLSRGRTDVKHTLARSFAPRDLDELGELRLRQRRVDEFELDRVALNTRHVLHRVGLQRLLGVKLFDRTCDQITVELHLLRIHVVCIWIRELP